MVWFFKGKRRPGWLALGVHPEHVDIVHITGEGKPGAKTSDKRYWSRPFVHEELADLYAITDLAVSRAGAGSIGELAGNGIPAILVPLEGVANNHQLMNAEVAGASGGCFVLMQSSLDQTLAATIFRIARDASLRTEMRKKIRSLFREDADVEMRKILLACSSERCPMP